MAIKSRDKLAQKRSIKGYAKQAVKRTAKIGTKEYKEEVVF